MRRLLGAGLLLLTACGAPQKVRPVFTHFDAPLAAYLCGGWQVTSPAGRGRGVLTFTGDEVTAWNDDGEQRSGFWKSVATGDPVNNGWHPLTFVWGRSERNGLPVVWSPPTELQTEVALRERDRMVLLDTAGWSTLRRVAACESKEGLPANWNELAPPRAVNP